MRRGGEPLLQGGTGSDSLNQSMPDFLPDRHEAGTHNVCGIGGLLAGLRFVRERRPEELLARECALTALAARGLRQLPGVEVFTGPGQSGVLSFRCRDLDCEEAAACLAEAGSPCGPGCTVRRWPTAAAERSRPERSG